MVNKVERVGRPPGQALFLMNNVPSLLTNERLQQQLYILYHSLLQLLLILAHSRQDLRVFFLSLHLSQYFTGFRLLVRFG